jgi:hypothetical protein
MEEKGKKKERKRDKGEKRLSISTVKLWGRG